MNTWNNENELKADDLASPDEALETPPVEFDTEVAPSDPEPAKDFSNASSPVTSEVPAEENNTRIGRAVTVFNGVVDNVILVTVDEEDDVVGFQAPEGQELFVVEDDSPVAIGWTYADGEFTEPVEVEADATE